MIKYGTPAEKKIEKFIYILWPFISNLLLSCKYIDIKILLDKARSIEKIKKDIIGNFSKQENPFTSKFSSQKSSKRFATRSESATLAKKLVKNLMKTGTNGSEDYTHLNSKFRLTGKKSEK